MIIKIINSGIEGVRIKIATALEKKPVNGGIPPRDRSRIWSIVRLCVDIDFSLLMFIIEEEFSIIINIKIGIAIIK